MRHIIRILACVGIVMLSASVQAEPTLSSISYDENKKTAILFEENRIDLAFSYKDDVLGMVSAYGYRGGVMLPLDRVMTLLGFPIFLDVHAGTAEGWSIHKEQTFFLDTTNRKVHIARKPKSYPDNLIIKTEDDIYIDTSLLARFFPLVFEVDHTNLVMQLHIEDTVPAAEKRWLEKHFGLPKEEAIWELHRPEEKEGRGKIIKETETENAGKEIALLEEDALILQPAIGRSILDEFIEAYAIQGHTYIPLEALIRLLEFPIDVDVAKGTATGWLIEEERQFSLDITEGTVTFGGETQAFSKEALLHDDFDIYVRDDVFATWFPLLFKTNLREMVLEIEATESLPFQQRLNRSKRWENLERRRERLDRQNKIYPLVEVPFQRVSVPFVDADFGQEYRSDDADKWFSAYSLQAGGDIGYMSTELYASGDSDNDFLGNLRLQAGRTDHDGQLLGVLNATEFEVGDINSVTIPLAAQTSLGRGVRVTNRPVGRASEFDVTSFIGDALPGWEVELYRNDALLDFRVVDNDGRYEFIDVPVLFGNNTFRLVFYGPQGQVQEEVKQLFIENSVLQKGEFIYEFSVDEKSKDLFGVSDSTINHSSSVRSVVEMEYGITDKLSFSLGGVNTPIENGVHSYVTTGLKASFRNVFLGSDVAYDASEGGWASKFTMLTNIKDISLKLEQRFFEDFASEEESPLGVQRKSQSELDINTFKTLPIIKDISIGMNVLHEVLENNEEETSFGNRISKSFLGVNVTHNLDMVFTQINRVDADIAVRGRVFGVLLGSQLDYRLSPDKEIDRVNITAQRNLTAKINTRLAFTKDLGISDRTSYNASVNWDRDSHRWSLRSEADDDGEIFMGMNINLSLGRNPRRKSWHAQSTSMSYHGAVSASAYLDKNYNRNFDEDDEWLEDVVFNIGSRPIKGEGKDTFFTKVVADRNTNITLDPEKLEDPLWVPGAEGYTVRGRPGVVSIVDFPVFATSEIDGTVYKADENDITRPLKNVEVQVINADGVVVGKAKTEYDGFYIIDRLLPGEYRLTIAVDDIDSHNAVLLDSEQVIIGQESDYYSGYDMTIEVLKEEPEYSTSHLQ